MGGRTDTESSLLEQRKDMFESGELQRELIRRLSSPEAIETAAAFVASPGVQRMASLVAKFSAGVATFLQNPEVQSRLKAAHDVLTSPEMAEVVRALSERAQLQGEDSKRHAVEAIAQELLNRQKEGPRVIDLEGHAVISIGAYADLQVSAPLVTQVGASDGTAKSDWSGLPTFILALLLSALWQTLLDWETARQGLVDLNARLPCTQVLSGVREFIRTELAGKPGDFRVVSGSGVALRAGPGTKSEVLLRLPYQAVVVVLEKEDRTWRYVSYQHEGYVIDGYVSSKYLKKVRREGKGTFCGR